MKQVITEEMKIHEKWFEEAKKQTVETLPEFIRHLIEDYQHDYGTICHAIGAAGLAGMYAVENSPTGGITGFQAGFCMCDIVRQWNFKNNKCGMKILDYDNLLYPQYSDKFFTISKDTWSAVQKEASERIRHNTDNHETYLKEMELYEKALEQFRVDVKQFEAEHPEYPPYENNPKFYQHLDFGTGEEWDAERKKEESGFMFEPRKPYDDVAHSDVVAHWKSIVDGNVPFGLKGED